MKLALASSLLVALPAATFAADVTITNDSSNQDSIVATQTNPTCDCQPFAPTNSSYQVTRLWNIVDPSIMTDQDVINEFNKGFAPVVTNMPGFQRYTASSTGDNTTVFFLNQFDTQEEAHKAQEAAKEFVANGMLNGKITPNIFTELPVLFGEAADACMTSSSEGYYLAARFYNWIDAANLNTTLVYSIAHEFYETALKDVEGFVTYYDAAEQGVDTSCAWDIFQTEENAKQSNIAASKLVLPDNWAVRAAAVAGIIAFDYTCAAGNMPAAPTPSPVPCVPSATNACVEQVPEIDTSTDQPSAAFGIGVSGASAAAAAIFMMLWKAI